MSNEQTNKEIIAAYVFLRKTNQTISDETLDLMKDAALEYDKLKEDNKVLLEALQGIIGNWDERNSMEPESKKYSKEGDFYYFSPVAGLISTEYIIKAKEALNKTK